MEKEILNKILSLLEQNKDEQLLILIGVFLLMIFFNILQAIYTSRIVDKYRNSLKKQEVKFSVYNQLQIEKLSELFEIAHKVKSACSRIKNILENEQKQEFDTNDLRISHEYLIECFNKNRYIFPKDIKEHFSSKSTKLSDFRFNSEFLSQKYKVLNSNDYKNKLSVSNKSLDLIAEQIKDYKFDKGSLEAMLFVETLKVKIENHFKEWE